VKIRKMSPKKYPKRPWRFDWRDSEGKRHYEYFERERDALGRRDEIGHRTRNLGERFVPSKITLAQFIGAKHTGEGWEIFEEGSGWWAKQGTKASTRRSEASNLSVHILPHFGGVEGAEHNPGRY